MIYTRMGTKVEQILGAEDDKDGNRWVRCKLDQMDGDREIFLGDLKADNGIQEIDEAIANATGTKPT